jgi:hypothetical protein
MHKRGQGGTKKGERIQQRQREARNVHFSHVRAPPFLVVASRSSLSHHCHFVVVATTIVVVVVITLSTLHRGRGRVPSTGVRQAA